MATSAQDARLRLVDQLRREGIVDGAVLAAMAAVERHRLLPAREAARAYANHPLEIGHGQTISQPYIVALMSELAQVRPGDRVLEIGTGSGYQAAVLAELGAEVFSLEIVEPLARQARAQLDALGYAHIHTAVGDGSLGWPAHAPFARIVLTAAPTQVPPALLAQLAPGGRLVAPVGDALQELVVLTRTPAGVVEEHGVAVRFVPMTGMARESDPHAPSFDRGPRAF